MVRLLLQHHANVNFPDSEGNSPLHLACDEDQGEVAHILTQSGAHVKMLNKVCCGRLSC